MFDVLIIGAGLTGLVCARELAEAGYRVRVSERRDHIGGNMYDYVDHEGFLVQKYGPHSFYTEDETIREYVERFSETYDLFARCRTVIGGRHIPMPFNYASIDMIYDEATAAELKKRLEAEFPGRETVTVTEVVNSEDELISAYGRFMYDHEYRLYTAKHWDLPIESISPEVFHRVPVYLSYRDIYKAFTYQFMPEGGFTKFAERLADHENIEIVCGKDLIGSQVVIEDGRIIYRGDGKSPDTGDHTQRDIPIIYTGEIDALLDHKYGKLPYRSLEFVWKHLSVDEYQDTEISAYPEADKILRVTEYKKFELQDKPGRTVIAIEIPMAYDADAPVGNVPYYPVKNDVSAALYEKYEADASKIKNLYLCGRLAEFKYYDMDTVINRAREMAAKVEETLK